MLHDLTNCGKLNEESIVVYGDIHGSYDLLKESIDQVAGYGAQVVFLGDYIDRGEKGVDVLNLVKRLTEDPMGYGFTQVTALMGNHEHMALLAAITGSYSDIQLWLQNGGRMEEFSAIRNDYQEWMGQLPTLYKHDKKVYYKGAVKNLICSHASIDPTQPLETQDAHTLIWNRDIRGYDHDTVTVHGHTPVHTPQYYETTTGPVIRVDTAAWMSGFLSGVIFQEVS